MPLKLPNISSIINTTDAETIILTFMVAVYPLIVIPGPLDYFRGPRYIVLALVSLLALYFLIQDPLKVKKPLFIPLAVFIFFATLSTFMAENTTMAWMGSSWRFTGLSTFLFCIILFFLASRYNNPRQILIPMILCAVIASIIGILQYFGYNFIPHQYFIRDSVRTYSTFGNINWFGTYVVFILPASILLYLNEKRPAWLATTAFIYAGLFVSSTRGVWLAFLASFLYLSIILFKNRAIKKHFFILLVAFLLITVIFLAVNDWELFHRASTIPDAVISTASLFDDSYEASGSVYVRLFIWRGTVELIKDNWAFGIGADHLRLERDSGKTEDKAHNIYLEIAVAMGVFALLSYLVFLSYFVLKPTNKTGFIFMMMIITYLIQGLFNNDIVQIMPLFWIVLGLSLANNEFMYSSDNRNIDRSAKEGMVEERTFHHKRHSSNTLRNIILGSILIFILLVSYWFFYPSQRVVNLPDGGVYTGELKGSTFHGYGILKTPSGTVYEGQFKNGYFEGFGTLTYPNGGYYTGEFEKGYFHGQGTLTTPGGEMLEGIWRQGVLIE